MPVKLKPSYPTLDAIPETQRDFYEINTTAGVYELAQDNDEIASYFNRSLAQKRDEFRNERDRFKRESERLNREVERLNTAITRVSEGRETEVTRLASELEAAQTALTKATTAGNVAITKEEHTIFERLLKLGKPEDVAAGKLEAVATQIETAIGETETLRTQVAQHALDETTREVSGLLDWEFSALRTVLTHPDLGKGIKLVVENVKDAEKKDVPTPFAVYMKDGKETKTELSEYATEHWKIFLPALETVADDNGGSGGGRRDDGTKLTRQKPSRERSGGEDRGKGETKLDKIADRFQKERDSAPNPLAPPKS